jgi:hypothetical protein
VADPSSATTATDHLLIELCRRADTLGKEIDRITTNESEKSYADDQTCPLHAELATIQVAIVNMPAQTFAGAVAKASHVRWCWAGDLTNMDDPLCMSIVRDLLEMSMWTTLRKRLTF